LPRSLLAGAVLFRSPGLATTDRWTDRWATPS
jgi:hypothetical protein